jgi:hypothetical protein
MDSKVDYMVSKVNYTVDYGFAKVDYTVDSRDFKKKIATVETSRQSIFCGFCCGFFIGFQWENERIRYKTASKPSKISVKVNSRLRGRSEILQHLSFLEKVDYTVDYGFKSRLYCRLWFLK